jgi:hypothetical protein
MFAKIEKEGQISRKLKWWLQIRNFVNIIKQDEILHFREYWKRQFHFNPIISSTNGHLISNIRFRAILWIVQCAPDDQKD